ncbi:MAG: lytic transglycosylase domain-containing protein [Defluviitaleaceae bacterium]|nr:lytic transglycosylase domain-containing protein [Defluviitaleaceae bacterium]
MKKKIKFVIFILLLFSVGFGVVFSIHTFKRYFPIDYFDIINKYANLHGVDPVIVASIINVESRFNKNAVSHAGASGLMQLMPGTAIWVANELGIDNFDFDSMIFDPAININMGTWYINRLIRSHSTIDVALAAYNAGSGNVSSWLDNSNFSDDGETLNYIPFEETRRYVRVVQISMYAYRFMFWINNFLDFL